MSQRARVTVACPFCSTLNQVRPDPSAGPSECAECGRPIRLDRPVRVTDETMHAIIEGSDIPVVVDFYADWCQPCKMMAPLLDQLASDLQGELLVAKLDTDSNPTMAVHHGIRGIPTLIVFREGREWKRQTGLLPPQQLAELLDIDVDVEE
jgi:thioredoxin 2